MNTNTQNYNSRIIVIGIILQVMLLASVLTAGTPGTGAGGACTGTEVCGQNGATRDCTVAGNLQAGNGNLNSGGTCGTVTKYRTMKKKTFGGWACSDPYGGGWCGPAKAGAALPNEE